jgi:hypothetical protein
MSGSSRALRALSGGSSGSTSGGGSGSGGGVSLAAAATLAPSTRALRLARTASLRTLDVVHSDADDDDALEEGNIAAFAPRGGALAGLRAAGGAAGGAAGFGGQAGGGGSGVPFFPPDAA